ncbi:hypothetical protein PENTCL1PPCAC_8963 [Pristionchus entomophagus]|uniref:C2 domain-containing protein n=1 Tax=Pristionchus entomophagus TaxID=358040 RepID=A0AAV5T1T1_9BILA|nr:hypothetical protein PENTCL1PPCAC_8963 [Pristionchus entomophagus]
MFATGGGVSDYLMFRLLTDNNAAPAAPAARKNSVAMAAASSYTPDRRASMYQPTALKQYGEYEAFCSPIVPHVPIRQRLAYRRCTSVDANEDMLHGSMSSFGAVPRRRKMSLLQSLRQQNKALADSGLDMARQRTDSESSPPTRGSPPLSPSKGALSSLKSKTKALFGGRKDSRPQLESRRTMHSMHATTPTTEFSQSCDPINGRSRKSPSTTNDSGRGSQGHLDERLQIDERGELLLESMRNGGHRIEHAIVHANPKRSCVERNGYHHEHHHHHHPQLIRTSSCPSLYTPALPSPPSLASYPPPPPALYYASGHRKSGGSCSSRSGNGCPLVVPESDDEIVFADRDGDVSDYEARLAALRLGANGGAHMYGAHRLSNAVFETIRRVSNVNEVDEDAVSNQSRVFIPSDSRPEPSDRASTAHSVRHSRAELECMSRGSMALTEDLADFDDSLSLMLLDHYLPLSRSSLSLQVASGCLTSSTSSSSSLDLAATSESWPTRTETCTTTNSDAASASTTAASAAQTDLSLIQCPGSLAEYLQQLQLQHDQEGMNFIAKHFFEYQSFVNLPHKAVQLHKTPPSQAGADPSMGWAPKNMNKAGKNQPAPAARANRLHHDPRMHSTKHGRAGKHEHREWGERHGELKDEKVAPHKDAWTKFLSNEDPGTRTIFECDFEDRVLQTDAETLPERLIRKASPTDDLEFQMAYNANKDDATLLQSSSSSSDTELLMILTYAPLVQFVTATVKKARGLPFNNSPFARIMLFEGRRLLEQKQTTINPSACRSNIEASPKPSTSSDSSSSSSGSDAAFSESFLFHVTPECLDKAHIVIEMFDHLPTGQTISTGHCVLGRLSPGTGHAHWLQMLRKPQLPVCMWHRVSRN